MIGNGKDYGYVYGSLQGYNPMGLQAQVGIWFTRTALPKPISLSVLEEGLVSIS